MIYEKIYNLGEEMSMYNYEGLFRLVKFLNLFCVILVCAIYTVTGEWSNVLYYSNEEYKFLEEEATKMIKNSDYNIKNTNYKYVIDSYDSETHTLNMKMMYIDNKQYSLFNNEPIIYIQAKNGKIQIERRAKNKEEHLTIGIIEIVGLIGILTYILLLIILIICYIVRKIENIYPKL